MAPDPISESSPEAAGAASFEDELENLERAVASLERGDLPLEEALRRYESGHRSLRRCHALLEAAEKRIEVLAAPLVALPPDKGPRPVPGTLAWRTLQIPATVSPPPDKGGGAVARGEGGAKAEEGE